MYKLFIFLVLLLWRGYSFSQNNGIHRRTLEAHKYNMRYAESLRTKSDFYFSSNNYEEAIRSETESLIILDSIIGDNSVEYAYGQERLSLYIANTGNYHKAIDLALDASNKLKNLQGAESELFAITSDKLSLYYSLIGDYENCLKYCELTTNLYGKLYGKEHERYVSSLSSLASVLSNLSRIEEAINIQKEIIAYYQEHGDSLKLAYAMDGLSVSYSRIGNYIKAIDYCERAANLINDNLGINNIYYYAILVRLSNYYAEIGQMQKANSICEKHLTLCKKNTIDSKKEYLKALGNYAYICELNGNYQKAIELDETALNIKENDIIIDSLDYCKTLLSLSGHYSKLGYSDKAIILAEKAFFIVKSHPLTSTYRTALNTLHDCHLMVGNYDEAIKYIEQAISSFEKGRKDSEYYGYLANLANCYYLSSSYQEAISIYNQVLIQQKRLYGEKSPYYLSTLEALSMCYSEISQYQDAINLQSECVETTKEIYGYNNINYALSLLQLGHLYRCVGEQQKAKKHQGKAVEIIKKINKVSKDYVIALLDNYWNYIFEEPQTALQMIIEADNIIKTISPTISNLQIDCMEKMSQAYVLIDNNSAAREIYEKKFERKDIQDYLYEDSLRFLNFLHKKADFYFSIKDYNKSLLLEKQVIEKIKPKRIEGYRSYVSSLLNMMNCYSSLRDTLNMIHILKEMVRVDYSNVYNNIFSLTAKNRESFWSKNIVLYKDILPILAIVSKDSVLLANAYNYSALFAKGILLREDIKISTAIKESNDTSLICKYNQLKNFKNQLNNHNSDNNIDSLLLITTHLESDIKKHLIGSKMISMHSVTWGDIKRHLGDKDIAIEFLSFDLGNENKGYAALLLKNSSNMPNIIPLFDKSQLDSICLSNTNNSIKLYQLIWEPLEKHFSGLTNIYFSPAGELYNLAIEYLSDKDGVFICDKFNVYRLSSTEELLLHSGSKVNMNKAVLYGGLNYSFNDSSTNLKKDKGEKMLENNTVRSVFRNSLCQRGNFEPLGNTLEEIREIAHYLSTNKVESKLFEGERGTEESIKNLTESTINILHIATHGMYIGDQVKSNTNELAKLLTFLHTDNNVDYLQSEDLSLTRSFLVMSGGNMLPSRYKIPVGMEDGILTAQEISRLNFENLDLVVLSACQSALGDVTNEGVLGLQRGFKKAGAKTILMSVDRVDDEATRILMVEFYRNLMDGKTKHQSLKNAQKYLRSVENGKYDDPKYWASFIMLDGLN